jgi:hypothetical protein
VEAAPSHPPHNTRTQKKTKKNAHHATEIEIKKSATRTKKGVKCVMWHKERYLRHATAELDMSPDDALAEWDSLDRKTADEDRDQLGPPQSRLRLPVQIEDYVIGENLTEHGKELRMESAKKKIKTAEDIQPMQDRLETGHAAMTDDMHRKTGAAVLKGIAKSGSSNVLDASGAGAFGGLAPGSEGAKFGSDLNLQADELDAPKKKRRYEIEFNRERLSNLCTEAVVSTKTSAAEALAKAISAEQVAADCADVVEGMGRWRQILRTRVEYLKAATLGVVGEVGEMPDWKGEEKDPLLEATDDQLAQVTLALTNTEGEEAKLKSLIDVFSGLKPEEDRALCTALRYEWNGTGFESTPNYQAIHKDFEWLKLIRTAELHLESFLAEKAKQRLPTPIEDIEQLSSLATISFTSYEAEQCSTEHDIKLVQKTFTEKIRVFKSLIQAAADGTKQLLSHIERQQGKEAKDKEKAENAKKKELEKVERAQKAKADADVKKSSKEKRTQASVKPLLTLQEPSVVLTSGADKITSITTFQDGDEFATWKSGKSIDEIATVGPYIVNKVRWNSSPQPLSIKYQPPS